MPQYLSPGVYVEEVPSAVRPIAGVGTSTAAFLGVIEADSVVPYQSLVINEIAVATGATVFALRNYPVRTDSGFKVFVNGRQDTAATLSNDATNKKGLANLSAGAHAGAVVSVNYQILTGIISGAVIGKGDGKTPAFPLPAYPAQVAPYPYTVKVGGERIPTATIQIKGDGTAEVVFKIAPPKDAAITADYQVLSVPVTNETVANTEGVYKVDKSPVRTDASSFAVRINGVKSTAATLAEDGTITFTPTTSAPADTDTVTVDYATKGGAVTAEAVGIGDDAKTKVFALKKGPVQTVTQTYQVHIGGMVDPSATILNDDTNDTASVFVDPDRAKDQVISVDYLSAASPVAPAGKVVACTSFADFKRAFGDFSLDEKQRTFAHAVYGFFNNGGTRCYAVRVANENQIGDTLTSLEAIDDIALVAAPGIRGAHDFLVTHCRVRTGDRFALLECDRDVTSEEVGKIKVPTFSDYAAFYAPWIRVFDPVTKTQIPGSDGLWLVPPTGHIAGVYARVDTERGVHKAPANEVVFGAVGLPVLISKSQQDALNPSGVNCIRNLNGNIRVWGARTMGGDANTEFKYVNVRRLFLFLRKSIDQGTQWVVFEPNDAALWAKITRNVTAFLTNVWRSGALFGTTPAQAFYVSCNEQTNLPELRDQGQVVTEVGVAVVKPAEFVIFRISQWAGPGK